MSIIPPFQPPQTTIEEVTPGRPIPHSGSLSDWFTVCNLAEHAARRVNRALRQSLQDFKGVVYRFFRRYKLGDRLLRGKGRWIMSPDEMSMWWLPEGDTKPEDPPVGGWDHA